MTVVVCQFAWVAGTWIVAQGTLEQVASHKTNRTAPFLKAIL